MRMPAPRMALAGRLREWRCDFDERSPRIADETGPWPLTDPAALLVHVVVGGGSRPPDGASADRQADGFRAGEDNPADLIACSRHGPLGRLSRHRYAVRERHR